MKGAAAHLVMELEEKLAELEGLKGKGKPHVQQQQTGGHRENRFKDKIRNNAAADLLHDDSVTVYS